MTYLYAASADGVNVHAGGFHACCGCHLSGEGLTELRVERRIAERRNVHGGENDSSAHGEVVRERSRRRREREKVQQHRPAVHRVVGQDVAMHLRWRDGGVSRPDHVGGSACHQLHVLGVVGHQCPTELDHHAPVREAAVHSHS
eukprot:7031615-Pyramimonas_sp.AAC.1